MMLLDHKAGIQKLIRDEKTEKDFNLPAVRL